jgi:RNA polymerase sigma factor (sigma-70 family)
MLESRDQMRLAPKDMRLDGANDWARLRPSRRLAHQRTHGRRDKECMKTCHVQTGEARPHRAESVFGQLGARCQDAGQPTSSDGASPYQSRTSWAPDLNSGAEFKGRELGRRAAAGLPERIIVVRAFFSQPTYMPTALDDSDTKAEGRTLSDFARNDSCHSSAASMGRRDLLRLLVQRIEQLPPRAKKILAMYYCESLQVSEIAIDFRLSECEVDQIRREAVDRLNDYLESVWGLPDKASE